MSSDKKSTNQHSHAQIAVLHVYILEGGHPEVDPGHDASLENSTLQVHPLQVRPAPSRILEGHVDTQVHELEKETAYMEID